MRFKTHPIEPGDTFYKLTFQKMVINSYLEDDRPKQRQLARCLCECGNTTDVAPSRLLKGHIRSCGCQRGKPSHGETRGYKKSPEYAMFHRVKQRAAKNNVPFNLTLEDIVIPDVCPLLGIELKCSNISKDNSPALDRKVPKLGYVKGNVWVISHKANRIKNDATPEQVMLVATKLKELL